MIKLIIVAVILVIIMVVFVFILFKNLIKRIEDNSKTYFINKMQDYDYILEEKQTILQDLNREIQNLVSQDSVLVHKEIDDDFEKKVKQKSEKTIEKEAPNIKYNLKMPEYRETGFFNNYKKIKEIFSLNKEQILKEFVEEHKNDRENKEFKELKKIRNKFNSEAIYECLTITLDEQKQVLKEVLTEKEQKFIKLDNLMEDNNFNIEHFIEMIDDRMAEIEPTIYVYVNGESNDYSYIDDNIITQEYANMSEGIIIKYRNKIYDYSI